MMDADASLASSVRPPPPPPPPPAVPDVACHRVLPLTALAAAFPSHPVAPQIMTLADLSQDLVNPHDCATRLNKLHAPEVRSIHWFPYDRVRVVNAIP